MRGGRNKQTNKIDDMTLMYKPVAKDVSTSLAQGLGCENECGSSLHFLFFSVHHGRYTREKNLLTWMRKVREKHITHALFRHSSVSTESHKCAHTHTHKKTITVPRWLLTATFASKDKNKQDSKSKGPRRRHRFQYRGCASRERPSTCGAFLKGAIICSVEKTFSPCTSVLCAGCESKCTCVCVFEGK